MNDSLLFPDWFDLICDVISVALPQVNILEEGNQYIGYHFDYPTLAAPTKSGFRSIYKSSFSSATDYGSAIKSGKNDGKQTGLIHLADLPSYAHFMEYSKSKQTISKYFENDGENAKQGLLEYGLLKTISDLVDHYKHQKLPKEFSPEALKPSYRMLEKGYFSEKLPIDIVVPEIFRRYAWFQADLSFQRDR